MRRRVVSGIMLVILMLSVSILALDVQSAKATGFIHVRPDGSVDPSTAPIKRDGNVYTLLSDVYDCLILIETGNIVVNGNGHKLQGVFAGFTIMSACNYVTIKNTRISSTQGTGIFAEMASHITLVQNVITSCGFAGIYLHYMTSDSLVSSNIIEDCGVGITLNATAGNNRIFHNDFINNVWQVWSDGSVNDWDNGYPSGGNYWSDYSGSDANNDGIGDTPYVIDESNRDRYPLMDPWIKPPPPNKPPVARFTRNPTTPRVGQTVTFDASSSSDPDGTIVLYKWSFGDGYTKNGKIVTHTYSIEGNYKVKLTVRDNDEEFSSTAKTITVVKATTDKRIDKAIAWALNRLGSHAYDYYCLRFVQNAYQYGAKAKIKRYEYAKQAADALGAKKNKGTPPRGAFAFYNWYGTVGGIYKNWGHVGLSLGKGNIVHAFNGLGVIKTSYLKYKLDGYIGWAWPPLTPPIKPSGLGVKATCPVDLVVTDPDDLVITKESSEISDAVYIEEDFDDDGSLDDYILISVRKTGEYSIIVVAEPDADPTATYTLEVSTEDATLILAENSPVSDIPTEPYVLDLAAYSIPPTTTLAIGEPQYIDHLNNIFASSLTSFNLTAEDNLGGSGVAYTSYRIYDGTSNTGWLNYTGPFNLTELVDGTYNINFNSTDNAGNAEPTNTLTVILDNTPPLMIIETPSEDDALQDGVTFKVSAWDLSAVDALTFTIQTAQGDVLPEFQSMPAMLSSEGKWELYFDTTQLPDGFYLFAANGTDVLGNWETTPVPFSIRNWACLELLPASENNKAGRTMPVKFALRVAASVDPNQPFVHNEDLAIEIYATEDSSSILQTSTFGDTARDYRINTVNELYITNFRTSRTPMQYTVTVYRDTFMIDGFEFSTTK